jgi:TPR repeat protein
MSKREADESPQASKRFREVLNNAADELVCPITQDLPVNPVTAEDGRIYEKSAIEEWINRKHRSPVTNRLIGPQLMPAVQVASVIRKIVTSGALEEGKADAWMQRLRDEEQVQNMRLKAEEGCGRAAWQLGRWHLTGQKGLVKDYNEAFKWYKKAVALGDDAAINSCGVCYERGLGVPQDSAMALVCYTRAATLGVEMACYNIGHSFAYGLNGLKKNEDEAKDWFKKMLAHAPAHNEDAENDGIRSWVKQWLRESGDPAFARGLGSA